MLIIFLSVANVATRHISRALLDEGPMRSEHVELVPLRIGEYHPVNCSLSDVDSPGPEPDQSLDFSRLVVGIDVNVQSVLADLRIRDWHEADSRVRMRVASNDDFILGLIEDGQLKSGCPKSPQRGRVMRIDDQLVKASHVAPFLTVRTLV